jgi:hypothetical protein
MIAGRYINPEFARMRFLFIALVTAAIGFCAGPAAAQSDAIFESPRITHDTMSLDEYNDVPVGLLLTPEQRAAATAAPATPPDPNAPPGTTPPPATAGTPPSQTGTPTVGSADPARAVLSYDEIVDAYRKGDFPQVKKSLEPLVINNHAGAQELLGVMYRMGQGVNKDSTMAFELLHKAAEAARPLAQHHLGSMYFLGEGTDKDAVRSLMWIGLAIIYYPDGPEKTQAMKDRDNIFLQSTRRDRDSAVMMMREWLTKRGEGHLLELQ